MELRHLRYFVVVAEELHFGRAAERLGLTQPALSKQIRCLEQELDFPLFHRTKRWVKLTRAGHVFLEQSRQLLEQADYASQLARRTARGELGQLAIAFKTSALHSFLPDVVQAFRERHQDVDLSMNELCTEAQVEALHKGQLDLGFLHPPIRQKSLTLKPMLKEAFVVVLPKQHPLLLYDLIPVKVLAQESFIIPPRGEEPVLYDQFFELCQRIGFQPTVVQETCHYQTRIGLVAAGMGVTFVPESVQHFTPPGAVCRAIEGPNLTLELVAAWRKDSTSPVLRAFLQVMEELFVPNSPKLSCVDLASSPF
jgi:DNA-binding transcriptional LysR family regulator